MTQESEADLRNLNEQLPAEENAGNLAFFEARLAPAFVLRRANGEVQDRDTFLRSLQPGGQRVCSPDSTHILPLGQQRALVRCLITIGPRTIDNARLFARNHQGRWQLLCWANE